MLCLFLVKSSRFSRQYWLHLIVFSATVFTAAFLALFVYYVYLQVNAFVAPYRNTQLGSPREISPLYQDITLATVDGLQLSGWYFPGTKPYGVVVVHGISANRMAVARHAQILAGAGYHLILLDLRGHGLSEGDVATYGYREAWDVQAAVDYLDALPDVEYIGALGTSFGGAAVARAAAIDERIAAVVIESSYSSLPAAIDDAFDDMSFFPRRPFAPLLIALAEQKVGLEISVVDSARDLATLHPRAVMIIHGTRDRMFPLVHAQRMYESAQEPKEFWVIEGLGHSNPIVGREEEYRQRVVSFFEKAFASHEKKAE